MAISRKKKSKKSTDQLKIKKRKNPGWVSRFFTDSPFEPGAPMRSSGHQKNVEVLEECRETIKNLRYGLRDIYRIVFNLDAKSLPELTDVDMILHIRGKLLNNNWTPPWLR